MKKILVIFAILILCGCKTQYIPVEKVITEYKSKTDTFIQKDSVHVKDSVFIHSKNDTVWYEKWHTKYIDKVIYETKIDTLIKKDSIQVPYPVEKPLTKWQQVCIDYGKITMGMSLVLVIILIIWIVRRIRGGLV